MSERFFAIGDPVWFDVTQESEAGKRGWIQPGRHQGYVINANPVGGQMLYIIAVEGNIHTFSAWDTGIQFREEFLMDEFTPNAKTTWADSPWKPADFTITKQHSKI